MRLRAGSNGASRWLGFVFAVAFTDCGGDTQINASRGRACAPGQTEPCTCNDGSMGAQICLDDGSGFDVCECETIGGSGGGGGNLGGGGGAIAGGATSGGAGGVPAGGAAGNGAGGSAGAGSVGGWAGTAGSGACSGKGPPAMVVVTDFCVDSTEVTNAQYAAFLASKGSDTSGQSAECAWNTEYTPRTTEGMGCKPSTFDPGGKPDHPVRCADWCDAHAYCKWAGKRLCGGLAGGPAIDTLQQWYVACSKSGAYEYGCAGNLCNVAVECVTNDYDGVPGYLALTDEPKAVASAFTCEGGYSGLYDMNGNLWEWEDSCTGTSGAADACSVRGGSFADTATKCLSGYNDARDGSNIGARIGFRCCSP